MRLSVPKVLVLVVPLALAAAGCGNSTSATTPTPTPKLVTDKFEGSLTTGGSNIHLLTAKPGDVVTTMTGIGPDPAVKVGMSIGVYSILSCTPVLDNPSSTIGSTLNGLTTATTPLCLRVYDPGTVASGNTLTYAVTVTYYQ